MCTAAEWCGIRARWRSAATTSRTTSRWDCARRSRKQNESSAITAVPRRHFCATTAPLKLRVWETGLRERFLYACEPRAQELLALVDDDQRRAGLDRQIPAGFILAGGGARLNGLDEMVEHSFHLPTRIAEPRGIVDLPEQVAQPEYATVVGLALYAAKAKRAAPAKGANLVSKLRAMFAGA